MQATMIAMMLWNGPAPLAVGESKYDKPTLTAYPAAADKATGAAVVICPGGGYGFLADDHEGKQAAEYMNKLGISAFVLHYRIVYKDKNDPNSKDNRPGPLGKAPLLDAQRAIRTVRSKAAEYKIDPKKIGIMGFSAGGHLASTAGTHYDNGNEADKDPIEKQSCRPDFMILAYPVISMANGVGHAGSRTNLFGPKPTEEQINEFSNEKHVTKDTPPVFIFHTDEDKGVLPENSVLFYQACKKHNIPAEMHIYEKGRHGVGLGNDPKWNGNDKLIGTWPDRLTDWLKRRGWAK